MFSLLEILVGNIYLRFYDVLQYVFVGFSGCLLFLEMRIVQYFFPYLENHVFRIFAACLLSSLSSIFGRQGCFSACLLCLFKGLNLSLRIDSFMKKTLSVVVINHEVSFEAFSRLCYCICLKISTKPLICFFSSLLMKFP